MSETQQTQQPADGAQQGGDGQAEGQQQEQKPETFTQADVDRIVKERVKRVEAKYADYDALSKRAGEAATVEERLAAMEIRANEAEARALRNEIATRHGISAEDRDLFLTGNDEDTLTAQAQRLAARDAEQKKNGNHAPREGTHPTGTANDAERQFARNLFGGA